VLLEANGSLRRLRPKPRRAGVVTEYFLDLRAPSVSLG